MVVTGKRLALKDATERLQAYKGAQALMSAMCGKQTLRSIYLGGYGCASRPTYPCERPKCTVRASTAY